MNIPKILYEDNHVLVAVKPAGVLSQEDITGSMDMLTLLKQYLCDSGHKPGAAYLGLLHRLDRPVSGVMVFAKTSKCASRISAQIREHKMGKKYRAVVFGVPGIIENTLRSYIIKDEAKNQVTVVPYDSQQSLPAQAKAGVLSYKRIGTPVCDGIDGAGRLSLLEVNLITGRSHQIRAQLADAGFPIVGDRKYGPEDPYYRGNLCLESFYLSFFHPVSGEEMAFNLPVSTQSPWNLFVNDFDNAEVRI